MLKLKRILAWVIDWNLSCIPALLYTLIFRRIVETQGVNAIGMLLVVFFAVSFPAIFVCQNVIFKEQSIARRIFWLRVADAETNEAPSRQKLITRNLFSSRSARSIANREKSEKGARRRYVNIWNKRV